MIKLFLVIFRKDKRIFRIFFNSISDPGLCWQAGRSTLTVDRTKGRSTHRVDRRAQTYARLAGTNPVDRTGRPGLRAVLSVCLGRPGGRPVLPNGHISDRWRSTGRSTGSLSGYHISLTASFWFGLYKPQLFGILAKVFRREKSQFSQSLKQVFKSVFGL